MIREKNAQKVPQKYDPARFVDIINALESHINYQLRDIFVVVISDETTAITTGTAKITFRMGYAFTLTEIPRASLTTASSSGTPTFDINVSGSTILSTKITIDANELSSVSAATPAVLTSTDIPDDAEITIDIDVAGTGAKGAKITLIGRQA